MAPGTTTTVRIRKLDSDRLRELASRREISVIDAVHSAIDALERQDFLEGLTGDYRRLRNDPERWQELRSEREEWDSVG